MADLTPSLPIPISYIQNRYLLFDTPTVAYLRREHNICGVLVGTIPHVSQQNVFLGVPLELTPEEARALVENGTAYVVDDAKVHRDGIWGLSAEERKAFNTTLKREGRELALAGKRLAEQKKEHHFMKEQVKRREKVAKEKASSGDLFGFGEETVPAPNEDSSLAAATFVAASKPPESDKPSHIDQWHITPLTSHPPLPTPIDQSLPLPAVTDSYPLFAHLYKKGYFMTPGLRFGCHYCVYPGDPLRYHSHFLASGRDWEEEFDLLDLVGGGRLGTAVKKGYLIGGREPTRMAMDENEQAKVDGEADVRTFCIEWAGM